MERSGTPPRRVCVTTLHFAVGGRSVVQELDQLRRRPRVARRGHRGDTTPPALQTREALEAVTLGSGVAGLEYPRSLGSSTPLGRMVGEIPPCAHAQPGTPAILRATLAAALTAPLVVASAARLENGSGMTIDPQKGTPENPFAAPAPGQAPTYPQAPAYSGQPGYGPGYGPAPVHPAHATFGPGYGLSVGAPQPVLADWVQRAAAFLIDGLLTSVPLWLGYGFAFATASHGLGPLGESTTDLTPAGVLVANLALVAALGVWIWNRIVRQGRTGQSVGKRLFRLRLVDEGDLGSPGVWTTFGREVAHVFDGFFYIGYLWPLWDAKHQTFADKIGRTLVLRDSRVRPHSGAL